MITYYFAKPGVGKTTYLAFLAIRENERINKGKSKYDRVLTNVNLSIPTDEEHNNVYFFEDEDFGNYDMSNSLILWDESSFAFDKTDWKSLTPSKKREIMLHRHRHIDIVFFNQLYSGLNNKIREICNRTYQLKRIGNKVVPYLVEFDIHIPKKPSLKDMDKYENSNGEVREVYYRAGIIHRIIARLLESPSIKMPKYWNAFDSYEAPPLLIKNYRKVASLNGHN